MMHRTHPEFDFWGRKYGTHTTPLQEQLAPPDDCRNCLNQNVLPHDTSLSDDTITGHFECPECSYDWTQTWQIQPVLSEPGVRLPA